MVPSRPARDQIPALLLVLAGLGSVLFAGVQMYDLSRTQYTYSISDPDREIYRYGELSAGGQELVRTAHNASGEVAVSGDGLDAATAFPAKYGPTIVAYEGRYYCIDVDSTERGDGGTVTSDRECERLTFGNGPAVHDFGSLSPEAQDVVERTLEAPDNEVSISGESPPEFESGADAPSLNNGIYLIQYQGEYYRLNVFSRGGLGVALLFQLLFFGGFLGLCLAVVGAVSYTRRQVWLPTILLVGLALVLGLFASRNADLLPLEFVLFNLGIGFVVITGGAVIVWLLYTRLR
ncbi:hypothetical protein Harman_37570 [Haloarcula mannanilytica]|uniref:DUF7979 domain-containing protein n=1 Tax=Haloarcula mannanilytica TaxID=2509225 RepID=A0A4C2ENK3_9EURY|nr:hypothetical protein [Haloarcula mannanilytica]GCF15822.1 hypothetical protein Harman_37570 [Haloarcula mannanilytica]